VEEFKGRSRANPDPADAPLPISAFELNHYINYLMGEVQNVLAGQLSSGFTALHEQCDLLEGLFGASGVVLLINFEFPSSTPSLAKRLPVASMWPADARVNHQRNAIGR
jgi:hypothetical protein